MSEIIKNITGIPHIVIENGVIYNILLADSFLFNKLQKTTGHGEGRLYVGPTSLIQDSFFLNFNSSGFFLKEDLLDFMLEARTEYMLQEQTYRRNIAEIYDSLFQEINNLPNNKLFFNIEAAQGKNDEKRYYIRSQGAIWE